MANALADEKQCTHCLTVKPLDHFSKERNTSNVYRSYCKKCAVKRVQDKRKDDPSWWRKYQLKRDFGLTINDYEAMLEAHGYRCAICNSLFDMDVVARKPNLDHCHKSGKVRGVLCFSCNTSIGKFGDDIEVLKSAISYLERNK